MYCGNGRLKINLYIFANQLSHLHSSNLFNNLKLFQFCKKCAFCYYQIRNKKPAGCYNRPVFYCLWVAGLFCRHFFSRFIQV